ncbi:hypothetical protein [Flavobacterium quisquiliarum]|uniref:Uncharacterized protein n=1 Tax=Flavobacterium quisquiliarum TaxID=1834436 RepID=A0ABV8W9U7_9FLAO|nr:hypothetical protein [Flavobacterium quisquiliarum]MBW1655357.1 hypothetical protein [Flavobacterium quisquiliarum]NWL00743.1 hypothetical protein [Flavobacterium collinsii]
MSAEFYINALNKEWMKIHSGLIIDKIKQLETFVMEKTNEYWLLGFENREEPRRWLYDVRIIFTSDFILLEISSHPPSIENTIKEFLTWIRERTIITVNDEDGEVSNW